MKHYLEDYKELLVGVEVDYNSTNDLVLTIKPSLIDQLKGPLSIFVSKYHNNVIISDNIHKYYDNDNDNDKVTRVTNLRAYKDGNNSIVFEQYLNRKGCFEKKIKYSEEYFADDCKALVKKNSGIYY